MEINVKKILTRIDKRSDVSPKMKIVIRERLADLIDPDSADFDAELRTAILRDGDDAAVSYFAGEGENEESGVEDDEQSDTASIATVDGDIDRATDEELLAMECREFIFNHYQEVCPDKEYAKLIAETESNRFLLRYQNDAYFRSLMLSDETSGPTLDAFLSKDIEPRNELEPFCLEKYKCKKAGKSLIINHMRIVKAIKFAEFLDNEEFKGRYINDKTGALTEFFKNEYMHPDWKTHIDYEINQKNNITKREPNTDVMCYTCNEKKVFMVEMQLRRPDEPMTKIYTCLSCGKEWRV